MQRNCFFNFLIKVIWVFIVLIFKDRSKLTKLDLLFSLINVSFWPHFDSISKRSNLFDLRSLWRNIRIQDVHWMIQGAAKFVFIMSFRFIWFRTSQLGNASTCRVYNYKWYMIPEYSHNYNNSNSHNNIYNNIRYNLFRLIVWIFI
jgi:hypothetical protein